MVEVASALVRFFQGTDLERIGELTLGYVFYLLAELSKDSK